MVNTQNVTLIVRLDKIHKTLLIQRLTGVELPDSIKVGFCVYS
jgi:hypothetical protein